MSRLDLAALAARCRRDAEKLQPYLVDLVRELIAIPSLSGAEEEIARRAEQECRELGLDVQRDRRGNMIARLGSGPLRILYDAHMDTVGPGERRAWSFDPYGGKFEDGLVFGRGACDNKGALAAMIGGLRIAQELGTDVLEGCELTLIGVVEEETCEGWAVGEAIGDPGLGLQPDYVILGECTDLGVARGHRGRCEIELITEGLACHGSSPWRGRNAIYEMVTWVDRLREMAGGLPRSDFLGPASLAVTRIGASSGSPNVIPEHCTAILDRRTIPGEDSSAILGDLKSAVSDLQGCEARLVTYDEPSYTGLTKSVPKDFPAWELDASHVLVRSTAEAARLITGREPQVGSWEFATDGVMTMGRLGIPTAGFGPGEERWAHTVWDQVRGGDLALAAAVYALLPQVLRRRQPGS